MELKIYCPHCGGMGEDTTVMPYLPGDDITGDMHFEYPNCPACDGSGTATRPYGRFKPDLTQIIAFIFPNGLVVAKDGSIISPPDLGGYQVGLRIGLPLVDPEKVSLE